MTQGTKEATSRIAGSKYWKLLLVILAGLFTFGSPYVAFMANHFLKRGIFFSFAGGFVSFAIGVLLVWYLIRIKVIT